MKNNENKTVLITGGSAGIGMATAARFFKEGFKVIITARNKEKLDSIKEEYPEMITLVSDAAEMEDIRHTINHIKTHFGQLDVLFVNAGMGLFKPFQMITEEEFDSVVNTNYKGVFFTIQEALKIMPDHSKIIVNTSWTHLRGLQDASVYSSTKAAIAYLVKCLAMELRERKISVNAISPGYINTKMFHEKALSEEVAERLKAQVPWKRFGEAQEIAEFVCFLASDSNTYLNGQDIIVDGGLTAVHHD